MITLELGIQGHDGAKVHRVHVLGSPCHQLLHKDSVSPFCWMESIPEYIDVPVGTKVRNHCA
jgi:hypothetical protein